MPTKNFKNTKKKKNSSVRSTKLKKNFKNINDLSIPYETNFNLRRYSKQYLESRKKYKEKIIAKANSDFLIEKNAYSFNNLSLESENSDYEKKIKIIDDPTYIILENDKRPSARLNYQNNKVEKFGKSENLKLKSILKRNFK